MMSYHSTVNYHLWWISIVRVQEYLLICSLVYADRLHQEVNTSFWPASEFLYLPHEHTQNHSSSSVFLIKQQATARLF